MLRATIPGQLVVQVVVPDAGRRFGRSRRIAASSARAASGSTLRSVQHAETAPPEVSGQGRFRFLRSAVELAGT